MTEVRSTTSSTSRSNACLPSLVEKTLERGWRAVVQAGSEERVEALDTLLWTYREESFLPHGTKRDGNAASQPVFLTTGRRIRTARRYVFSSTGPRPASSAAMCAWSISSMGTMRLRWNGRASSGRAPGRQAAR